MVKTWVISDLHLGHENVCTKFTREDGSPLRPFACADEMDRALIDNWNSVVSPQDRVYVLGDVVMRKQHLYKFDQMVGRKVLVKGNHDIFEAKEYLKYFDDLRSYVVKKTKEGGKLIMSHIPVHPESLGRFGLNIHGHLHANNLSDSRYVNVSVEQTNYFPIELEEAIKRGRV